MFKCVKKILKTDCVVIVIPFVRFEGYWLPEKYLNMILDIEEKQQKIVDLDDLRNKHFNILYHQKNNVFAIGNLK